MAKNGFARCHAVTKTWEGGWSNHPADPGGRTMYGVTEAVYHAWLKAQGRKPQPVRSITQAEAELIYKANYWGAAGCETLAPGVDLAVYDAAVNSGVARSRGWLGKSIGGSDANTVRKHCALRLSFVRSLRTWKTFGRGWARRIADIEAKGVAWALSAAGASAAAVKAKLVAESDQAGRKSQLETGRAGSAGAGVATGGVYGATGSPDPVAGWVLVGLLVFGVVVTVLLIRRAMIADARAKAYEAEANAL